MRVTGSGLGCPTWPSCNPDSLAADRRSWASTASSSSPTACSARFIVVPVALGHHRGAPAEASRALADPPRLVAVLARRRQRGRRRHHRARRAQPLGRRAALRPGDRAADDDHSHLAPGAREGPGGACRTSRPSARRLSWALVVVTLVLILVGTLVTGSGPHSGDSADVPRMPLDWTAMTIIHGAARRRGPGPCHRALGGASAASTGAALAQVQTSWSSLSSWSLQGAIGVTQALDRAARAARRHPPARRSAGLGRCAARAAGREPDPVPWDTARAIPATRSHEPVRLDYWFSYSGVHCVTVDAEVRVNRHSWSNGLSTQARPAHNYGIVSPTPLVCVARGILVWPAGLATAGKRGESCQTC